MINISVNGLGDIFIVIVLTCLILVALMLAIANLALIISLVKGKSLKTPVMNFRGSITKAPGSVILVIAEFIYSKKTYEGVFLQNILDMREEYFEALAANRKHKARWVLIRGYAALATTVFLQFGFALTSKIVKTFWG